MLSRRSLLGGLLACVPLFGMRKNLNKKRYISFLNKEPYPCSYDGENVFASVAIITNGYFEVFNTKTIDLDTFNALILIGHSYEWIHGIKDIDCTWQFR